METPEINRILSKEMLIPKKAAVAGVIVTIVAWGIAVLCLVAFLSSTMEKILVPICVSFLFLAVLGGCVYFVVEANRQRAYIALCMEDAVKVKAYAKPYGMENGFFDRYFGDVKYGLKVIFHIDGKKYTRTTFSKERYRVPSTIMQYANKTIWIWYSKKQDEVLFPKKDWVYDEVSDAPEPQE